MKTGDDRDSSRRQILFLALIVYGLWVIATYAFEGRIFTLIRPEAVLDRIIYTVIANILIGILLAMWVLRKGRQEGITTRETTGFRSPHRTIFAVILGFILGFLFLLLQNPPSLDPVVFLNVYAQVLTVTIAEVTICWALVGSMIEGSIRDRGRLSALIAGFILASLLFGIYHLGHSPPFNQPSMMVFLSLIGMVTSLVYFIGRDIYATITFHNFLGVMGVMQALDAAGVLATYRSPILPVIGMASLSLIVFILMDGMYVRRGN